MNKFLIPVIASILILGTMGISYDAFADRNSNNGNNGCEKSNPNAKACEKNPNANKFTSCDLNSDGALDADELFAHFLLKQNWVVVIEFFEDQTDSNGGITNYNGFIDTLDELDTLNARYGDPPVGPCI